MRFRVLVVALVGVALSVVPAAPAAATAGAVNVQFNVTGSLSQFPCPSGGCTATISPGSTGTGAGHAYANIAGDPYDATFTIYPSGTITGSAVYAEPGQPFCPLLGFANNSSTGQIVLSGGTTGIIYNLNRPFNGGVVTSATTTLNYNYTRVGVTPVLQITGGSVTVNYYFPATGPGSFTDPIINVKGTGGAGTGVFTLPGTSATQLLAYCNGTPGTLVQYAFNGDATYAIGAVTL
jgi:hypothetical protein